MSVEKGDSHVNFNLEDADLFVERRLLREKLHACTLERTRSNCAHAIQLATVGIAMCNCETLRFWQNTCFPNHANVSVRCELADELVDVAIGTLKI